MFSKIISLSVIIWLIWLNQEPNKVHMLHLADYVS